MDTIIKGAILFAVLAALIPGAAAIMLFIAVVFAGVAFWAWVDETIADRRDRKQRRRNNPEQE